MVRIENVYIVIIILTDTDICRTGVWHGSDQDGSISSDNCNSWTSFSYKVNGRATVLKTSHDSMSLFHENTARCNSNFALLCIQLTQFNLQICCSYCGFFIFFVILTQLLLKYHLQMHQLYNQFIYNGLKKGFIKLKSGPLNYIAYRKISNVILDTGYSPNK